MNASPLIFLTKVGLLEVRRFDGNPRRPRRCAQAMKIPMQGTLGLVLPAKRIGLIKAVVPVVEDLEHAGMCMTTWLKTQILSVAGE